MAVQFKGGKMNPVQAAVPWRGDATALQAKMKQMAQEMLSIANKSKDQRLQASAERVLDQVNKLYSDIQLAASRSLRDQGF